MLSDGTYDAFVLDVEDVEDVDDDGSGEVRVELTITAGPHRGEVITVRGGAGGTSAADLLGVPVTLVVEAGVPRLQP